MDINKVKSIENIINTMHEDVNKVYEGLMDEELEESIQAADSLIASLKHLKTNLKTDEI